MKTDMRRYFYTAAMQIFFAMGLATASIAQSAEYDVPFLTVRDTGSEEGPSPYFGDARSTLSAGRCLAQRADTGGLTAVLESGPAFIQEQLLSIEQVDVEMPDDLLNNIEAKNSGAFALYVHGYSIGFEKGCRRAALLQRNANLDGRMVWFTWPSDGDLANYVQDEADLYWSVPDIAGAIIELNARSSVSIKAGIDQAAFAISASCSAALIMSR